MMRIFMIVSLINMCASVSSQIRFTYHWRQIDGVVETIIETPDSANTIVSGLNAPGEYFYEFSVCNDFGCGLDTMKITVLPEKTLALGEDTISVVIRPPDVKKLEVKAILRDADILLQIRSPRAQKVRVMLFNQLGQALAEVTIPVKKGFNFASLPAPRVKGIYFIWVVGNYQSETLKIMI